MITVEKIFFINHSQMKKKIINASSKTNTRKVYFLMMGSRLELKLFKLIFRSKRKIVWDFIILMSECFIYIYIYIYIIFHEKSC